jgi:hypothetical protein
MTPNAGLLDRAIRIAIGALLIAFAIAFGFADTGWNWVGWIGIVPVITAVLGYSGPTVCLASRPAPPAPDSTPGRRSFNFEGVNNEELA